MKVYLDNIGIVKDSELIIDGLTVVCGANSSGKSTIGKIVYSIYNAIENLEARNIQDKLNYGISLIKQIVHSGESQYLYRYFNKSNTNFVEKTFLRYLSAPLPSFTTLDNLADFLLDIKNQLLQFEDFSIDKPNATEKNNETVSALIDRLKLYVYKIDSFISLLEIDPDMNQYTNDWIAKSIGSEMCNQVQPVRIKDAISTIRIEDNAPEFLMVTIKDKTNYNVKCNRYLKSVFRVFLLDNILDLDQSTSSVLERFNVTLNRSDETIPIEYYELMNSRMALKHNNKNRIVLSSSESKSVIEESEIGLKIKHILEFLDDVIPGSFSSRNDGMYYTENDVDLNAQNLASGAKLMAMIKILLMRGLLDEQSMLILDEPECHLHPEWQRRLAIIICLMIRDLSVKVLVTTHNPNFMLALDTYSLKYDIRNKTYFYLSEKIDGYLAKFNNVNDNINQVYASLSKPFLELDVERNKLLEV